MVTMSIPVHTVTASAPLQHSCSVMVGSTASGQRPVWVCKYYSVILGPLGKHFLLGDESVSPVRGVFVEKILVTFILPLLIVMIGDFSIPLCPGRETKREED